MSQPQDYVTLEHLNGTHTKVYPARRIGFRLYVHPPMSEAIPFSLRTGQAYRNSMRFWKLKEEDRLRFSKEFFREQREFSKSEYNRKPLDQR